MGRAKHIYINNSRRQTANNAAANSAAALIVVNALVNCDRGGRQLTEYRQADSRSGKYRDARICAATPRITMPCFFQQQQASAMVAGGTDAATTLDGQPPKLGRNERI